MFRVATKKNSLTKVFDLADLVYHATVRSAHAGHSNALFGLILNIVQSAVFIMAIYVTMTLLGARGGALRGDFVMFLVAGVMSYMTFNKTMKKVFGAEGPSSPMMLHLPMTPAVSIMSSALSALYLQSLAICVILFIYHVTYKPLDINQPTFAFSMVLASWFFGLSAGMVLLALKPWAPKLAPILIMIVSRVNVFASGKMMVGNALSFSLLRFFDWNPLFHLVDQMRGAIFINYIPRNSSVSYAMWTSVTLFALGLMGLYLTRKYNPGK
jgi:ABC-type polysaccharide/polyol phosphate export permease